MQHEHTVNSASKDESKFNKVLPMDPHVGTSWGTLEELGKAMLYR